MATKPTLFIFSRTEDGNYCEQLPRHEFDKWVKERTEGIKPECHPKFITTFPNYYNKSNEFMIVEGSVIVPNAVTIVQSYTLDGD